MRTGASFCLPGDEYNYDQLKTGDEYNYDQLKKFIR